MKHTHLFAVLGALSLLGFVAHGARATDVKLVKQPKTFPIVISAPGSYRLKSNISVPDANTTAISVQADYVTIDLNGYNIQGPVVCMGEPVTSCSPTGSGIGIDGGGHTGLAVHSGFVRGMGDAGLSLGNASRVENVTTASNGGVGIQSGNCSGFCLGASVTGCMAYRNGGGGISVVKGAVHNSSAVGNGGDGIQGDAVTGSAADLNQYNGISAFSVTGSTANSNTQRGIITGIGIVANSAALGNGSNGIASPAATGCAASGNGAAPQILATGITGNNLCNSSPCP